MDTSTPIVAPAGAERTGAITIVAVPAGHPYVRQTTADPRVSVLPDPVAPGADPAVWWPPAALDPTWIRAHADAASHLHIHFGTESFPPGHLTACLEAAHRAEPVKHAQRHVAHFVQVRRTGFNPRPYRGDLARQAVALSLIDH